MVVQYDLVLIKGRNSDTDMNVIYRPKKHMRLSEPWREGCNRFYLDAPQEKPTLLIT